MIPITAIIPTYNRARLIGRAITSVISQLNSEDEVIVIDDGSVDDTQRVVKGFGPRVQYIVTPNRGAGAARNTGVKNARNELIAFCDSDDEWLPGKVEIQRAFMQSRPDILFCFSNFFFKETEELGGGQKHFFLSSWPGDMRPWNEILDSGHKISSLIALPEGIEDFKYYTGNIYLPAMTALYMNVNTLIARKGEAADSLHFAEDTATYEDWECFGRLAQKGTCAYLDLETACQHSHGGVRLTDAHITVCAETRVKIIERVWGNDPNFIIKHGRLYRKTLDEQRLLWIKGLIVRGDLRKAREQIKLLAKPPIVISLLTNLPRPLVLGLLSGYRFIKKI